MAPKSRQELTERSIRCELMSLHIFEGNSMLKTRRQYSWRDLWKHCQNFAKGGTDPTGRLTAQKGCKHTG